MILLGIDPGLSGGIVFMSDKGDILHYQRMPVKPVLDDKGNKTTKRMIDITQIAAMIARFEPEHVFIEKVHSMPKQGVASTFTFGVGYGMLLGLFYALEALLHTELVPPQRWQKLMYAHMPDPKSMEPKERAKACFSKLWPDLVRQNVTHDGIIDAVLICEYGRRTLSLN